MYKFLDDIHRELTRLGVKQGSPSPLKKFLKSNWHTSTKTVWQNIDPLGEFTAVSDFYQWFLSLRWLAVGDLAYLDPDDEIRQVQMCQASENYDLNLQGQRVLLYAFAYDKSYQLFCSVDLLEKNANPKVYAVPHDEYERAYVRYNTLSEFLQTLHTKESLMHLTKNDEDEE